MENSKKEILNRINYVLGHVKGVKKMVEEGKYCIDIMLQNQAVASSIRKINQLILEDHLNTCVTEAIKSEDEKQRREKVDEILQIFKRSEKAL